jgi:beta-N-acetylglucosaminidase
MKHDEINRNNNGVRTLDFIGNEDNTETVENIQNKLQISNMNVNIKNYRMDNFKQLRNKFDKISVSTKHQKTFVFEKIFKNTNKEKNDNVINQINSLLVNIDNLKTKSTAFSPEVKDSLLNSYKDFIAVKEINKFYKGVSILELKKEQFLKNTKIFEVKFFEFLFKIKIFILLTIKKDKRKA